MVILEKSETEEEVKEVASAGSEVGEEASKESLHAAEAEKESHAVFNLVPTVRFLLQAVLNR